MPEFLGFHYVEARTGLEAVPVLALHGSGGSEDDLLPLAAAAAPDRPLVAVRGGVDWEGGYAFFRRHPDRTLDVDDLDRQTSALCRFIASALSSGLLSQPPVLLGYSNGAIMAASILRHAPQLAAACVLLRPLTPAPDATFPALRSKRILILSADGDSRRRPDDAMLMTQQLLASGASVEAHCRATGHGIHADEPGMIRDWLQASSE